MNFHKLIFGLLAAVLSTGFATAQTKITGSVTDSTGAPVSNASVSLIRLSDSSLVTFYLTDEDGTYQFNKVAAGKYRVHATHVAYHGETATVEANSATPEIKIPPFKLTDASIAIQGAVIVADIPPVMLRGDTLEFNAGSFRTAPNSVVEDMLKKIPGVEVQSDGTIKVNGQQVNKILVDGKEFFGNDPRIATQNLPAESVDKVQVYDDKNEAEQITGMSDGEMDMTINLKLKGDHKKGVFGQVTGGGGTDENLGDLRWKGKLSLNAFQKDMQANLIANANNINEASFSFRELMQVTGMADEMFGGGIVRIEMNEMDLGFPVQRLINSNSQGINTQASGGLRLANSWGEKLTLSGSYLATWYRPELYKLTQRTYFLPDSTYEYSDNATELLTSLNHRVQGSLVWKPQKKTTLRVKPSVTFYDNDADITNLISNTSTDGLTGSQSTNSKITNSGTWNFSNDARFTHGFKRKGRSLSANWNFSLQGSDSEQTLDNQLNFFSPDTTFAGSPMVQRWFTAGKQTNTSGRVAWTEPFLSRWLLEANVAGGFASSENVRDAFSFNTVEGSFTDSVPGLSAGFDSKFNYGSGGLQVRRAGKKINFAVGADYQLSHLTGSINNGSATVDRNFAQLLPNGRLEFILTKFKSINFNYRTRLQPPSVTQLQPLPDPSNPLYQQTGNPGLNPQVTHNVSGEMRFLNPSKQIFNVLFVNAQIYNNAIGESREIDSLGITRVTPLNVNGNWNLNGRYMIDFPVKALKSSFNIEPQVSLTRTQTLVNGLENPSLTWSVAPEVGWDFEPTDSFELELSASYRYGQTDYAIGDSRSFTNFTGRAELTWYLPKGFILRSDFRLSQVTGQSETTTIPLWTGSLSKFFFKGNRLEARASVFDVLGQNQGVSQNTLAAYTEAQTYNVLSRYFMLSLTWRLKPYTPGNRGNRQIQMIRE